MAYIAYFGMVGVPHSGTDPVVCQSIADIRDKFAEYSRDMMYDDCYGSVYWHDAESMALAEEFRGVGIPFDYPMMVIERGPRNGITVQYA